MRKTLLICASLLLFYSQCPAARLPATSEPLLIVSVPDQKLVIVHDGALLAEYPVSTSRFGIGDGIGSYATPLGALEVANKIGAQAPTGEVFKGRRPTGEIVHPNASGRDAILSRILCLRGLESANRHAFERGIYIHGTPVERLIGRPASYGCIRMRSCDIIQLFNTVGIGARVQIVNIPLKRAMTCSTGSRPDFPDSTGA